jgi:(E)-4-hydroxy-3-methylbut-2-enyl-diphosphate synthase
VYLKENDFSDKLHFILMELNDLKLNLLNKLNEDTSGVIVLTTTNSHGMAEQRRTFFDLMNNNIANPVIIKRTYENIDMDQLRLFASTDLGGLLIDGLGDGVWLKLKGKLKAAEKEFDDENKLVRKFVNLRESHEKVINRTLFGILQAARVRISKTEYIACPSCGRTLFDLQITTDMIRKRTEHLKGVKIAVMGCIVNGPGEMADADYGYVGSGIGKITLYRAKDIVKRNVSAENAVDELIQLIKEDNNWVDPN